MNSEELQKYWDQFAPVYTSQDANLQGLGITLFNMMKAERAKSIIEAACGGGSLYPYVLNAKSSDCR